jgi:hypothetical protein
MAWRASASSTRQPSRFFAIARNHSYLEMLSTAKRREQLDTLRLWFVPQGFPDK